MANFQRVAIPGAIFDLLQRDLNAAITQVTALGASFMYVYALSQLVIGLLVDRYGGIRVISCGAILFALGVLLFPLSHYLPFLYLSRALTGMGASSFYLSLVKEIRKAFPDRNFGLALSAMIFVGYVGGIVANAPFVLGAERIGWRNMLLLAGLACALFAAVFIALGRYFKTAPVNRKVRFSLAPFREALGNRRNVHLFAFASLNYGLYYVIQTVIGKKFLEDFAGMTSSSAALVLSTMVVISACAGAGLAVLSRMSGNRRIIFLRLVGLVCGTVFLVISLCLAFGIRTPLIAVLLFMLAMGGGLSPLLVPIIHSTNRYEITGTTLSIMNCCFFLTVGFMGNASGFLMNLFPPVSRLNGVSVYGAGSYLAVFGTFFALSLIEIRYALKLQEPAPPLRHGPFLR
jgi:MFS family permease